jgi:hypothetical protein
MDDGDSLEREHRQGPSPNQPILRSTVTVRFETLEDFEVQNPRDKESEELLVPTGSNREANPNCPRIS